LRVYLDSSAIVKRFSSRSGSRTLDLLHVASSLMSPRIDLWEELLRNPEPGSAVAAARDFGIDLTLVTLMRRLRKSVESVKSAADKILVA
jgi:hypothetical protein